MFLSISSSSSKWLFVGLCRAVLLSTVCTAASLRLMLPVVSGSSLRVAISSSCHDTVAPSSVVGRFLLQARQPGTRCQTISVIRGLPCTEMKLCLFECLAYLYYCGYGQFSWFCDKQLKLFNKMLSYRRKTAQQGAL